jgi:hypothetical protein
MHGFISTTDISTPDQLFAQQISLANFANYANMLASFDQYRIREITMEWIPHNVTSFITSGTVATVAPTGVYNHNILVSCVDTDDSSTPATATVVLGHESAIVHGPFVKSFRRTFKPAIAVSAYQGAFTGFANFQDQWIDSASSGIQHYGVKYALSHGTTAPPTTVYFSLYCHALVDFRKRY